MMPAVPTCTSTSWIEPQSADRLVYQVTDHPTRVPSGVVTEDGRYCIIGLFDGYESNAWLVQDLRKPDAKAQPLFTAVGRALQLPRLQGRRAVFPDHQGRAAGRVIAVDAT